MPTVHAPTAEDVQRVRANASREMPGRNGNWGGVKRNPGLYESLWLATAVRLQIAAPFKALYARERHQVTQGDSLVIPPGDMLTILRNLPQTTI